MHGLVRLVVHRQGDLKHAGGKEDCRLACMRMQGGLPARRGGLRLEWLLAAGVRPSLFILFSLVVAGQNALTADG